MLKRFKIRLTKNIINFNEIGTRVRYTRSEEVIILIKVMELYKVSPENYKSIIICKAICVNGSKPPPLFIIIPSKKVIKA